MQTLFLGPSWAQPIASSLDGNETVIQQMPRPVVIFLLIMGSPPEPIDHHTVARNGMFPKTCTRIQLVHDGFLQVIVLVPKEAQVPVIFLYQETMEHLDISSTCHSSLTEPHEHAQRAVWVSLEKLRGSVCWSQRSPLQLRSEIYINLSWRWLSWHYWTFSDLFEMFSFLGKK